MLGAKIVGVFRVKNHDFTPKNLIFSNFRGGARWVRVSPPWIRPCVRTTCTIDTTTKLETEAVCHGLLCVLIQIKWKKMISGERC